VYDKCGKTSATGDLATGDWRRATDKQCPAISDRQVGAKSVMNGVGIQQRMSGGGAEKEEPQRVQECSASVINVPLNSFSLSRKNVNEAA